jgi:HK97 gp10 family phage protein
MAKIFAKLEGTEYFDKILKEFNERDRKAIILAAARAAAKPLIESAKQKAPVGFTGVLYKSIGAATVRQNNKEVAAVQVGPRKSKNKKADPWYARFVEYGTSKSAARPFMTPAWAESRAEVQKIMGVEVGKAIVRKMKAIKTKANK